jgi:DNA polymerase-3 subunit gamma/tau
MENFIVSARKYRPSRFEDVVGQPQVTNTLKNAIRTNQLAQAFLFCGPRGVGKTTCARILAKAVNCENLTADFEPCNTCASCEAFNKNASFNIHELDAASNNSVEDIRSLIDQVRFAPQEGKKKIYIIDEVHMLSQQAFNAFLKTLEEPPSYAIFILATTEKHKIIPTILSRCQIFDFNRIKTDDMVKHLAAIAKKEGIRADEDALHIIAQKADGALRDALSMFDRISIFSNHRIHYADAVQNLNILDYDYFFKLTDFFLTEDTSSALLTFHEILQKGFDGENFLDGLSDHFRDLLVAKDAATVVLMDFSENIKKRYSDQAPYTPASFLVSALAVLNEATIQYRTSRNKRLTVELALIKLCHLHHLIEVSRESSPAIKKKIPETR